MTEPVVTMPRFSWAANRLEVLRGIENAPTKLFARMTRRYKAWRLRGAGFELRLTDRGPA